MKKIRQVIALLLISTLIIGQLVTDEFAYAINSNSKNDQQEDSYNHNLATANESNSYTITYAPMGGNLKETSKKVYQGETYGTLPTPELSGYVFQGWYTQEEGGEKVIETTPLKLNAAHILYARWKPISTIIRFHANGGIVDIESKAITYGSKYGELPIPTLESYTFLGWFTDMSGGELITATDIVNITSETMVYARWGGKELTVSFETSTEEQLTSVNRKYGNTYGTLPIPTRYNYVFSGWYLPGHGIVNSDTVVTLKENHTLYAKWQEYSYSVYFNPNGGKVSPSSKEISLDNIYGSLPTPTKKGYTFLGWYTSDTESGELVTSTSKFMGSSLYARWLANQYEVILDGNGVSIPESKITVNYEELYSNLPELSRENYTFMGWYTAPTSGTKVDNTTIFSLLTNQTLYAQWQGHESILTFDANGGKTSTLTKPVNFGSTYGTLPKPTRTGYQFIGWFTEKTGMNQITEDTTVRILDNQTLYAYWIPKNTLVTFTANGGEVIYNKESVSSFQVNIPYGESYGVLPEPKREGYTFDGWYTASTGGVKIDSTSVNTATTSDTIYAQWIGNEYTINFDATGGTSSTQSKTIRYGSTYGTLPIPERSNYTFEGWYTDIESGTKITASTSVKLVGAHTLYARWRGIKSSISFDNQLGTTTSSISVYYNEAYGTLPKPSLTGYDFLGWFTSATGGIQVTAETIVKSIENQTLYARWRAKNLTITFDATGGSVGTAHKTVTYGDTYGPLPTPSRPGFVFKGWFTSKAGTTQITSSDRVSVGSDDILYAQWTANNYIVSFNANGGTTTATNMNVVSGQTYGTLPKATRSGYSFGGWYTKISGGIKVLSTTKIEIAGNHTLYAHWTQDVYSVKYNANGGTVYPTSTTVTKGTTYSDFPTPIREGYTFKGWYSSTSSSASKIDYTTAADTLYAHWLGNTYYITFDANGGSVGTSSKSLIFGSTYGTLPTPTRQNYEFKGWYTELTGGYKKTSTSSVSTAADHVLYARWDGITSKLSYNSNGGTSITTTTNLKYGNLYGTLKTPTRTGYDFLGWYTAPSGGTQITADTIITTTTNQTVYAHWAVKMPTITFNAYGGKVLDNELLVSSLKVNKTYGQPYGELPIAVRDGYTFLGWFTSSVGTDQVHTSTIVNATTSDVLYAHWVSNTYTVNLDPNGGAINDTSIIVQFGETYGNLPVPSREGFNFDGWFTNKLGGEQIKSTSTVNSFDTQTLYAHWSIATYKVTYDFNGGSITKYVDNQTIVISKQNKQIIHNGTYADDKGQLPGPKRTGFMFAGFYTELNGGTRVTAMDEFTINREQTLYAHWTPIDVTIVLNENSGDALGNQTMVTYNTTYGILPTPHRAGHSFLGWYTSATGNTQITSNTQMTKTSMTTIYAKWQADSFHVTFDAKGGTVDIPNKTVEFEKEYGVLPTPTYNNHKFLGWFTEPYSGSKITSKTVVGTNKDSILYAQWEKSPEVVIFDGNGGVVPVDAKYIYFDKPYGTLPTPYNPGKIFLGWYTDVTSGKLVSSIDIVKNAETHTLYARWKPREITLIFQPNGGNIQTPTRLITYGEIYGILPIPTLENYTFQGWYTSLDGNVQVNESHGFYEEGTYTLYAHWTPNTYTVSYDANGGEISQNSKEVIYDGFYGTLAVPTKSGSEFAGWFTEREGGREITFGTKVTIGGNHTLYARWGKQNLVLTFDPNGGETSINEIKISNGLPYGPLPVPTRVGYDFTGWYTQKVDGVIIKESDIVNTESSFTVYARWIPKSVKVEFNAMGGTVDTTALTVTFGESYGELPLPKYKGYTFVNWYLEEEGKNVVTSNTSVTTDTDHMLYAYWIPETEKINPKAEAFHYGTEGINLASGNVSLTCTDSTISIPGLTFNINRTYNSKNESVTKLGRGWSFGFEGYCIPQEEGVIIVLPNGSVHEFKLVNGIYKSQGSHAKLNVLDDSSCVLTMSDQSKYGFAVDGTMDYIEDRYGNKTKITYADGKMTSIVDSTGRKYQIITNEEGYITKIVNPAGNSLVYEYNKEKLLSSVTNLVGGVTHYEYDSKGYLTKITDPNGNVVQEFTYTHEVDNKNSEVTQCINPDGTIITYLYNPEEHQTTLTSGDGRKWIYWYDSNMYVTDIQNPDNSMSHTEYYETDGENKYGDIKSKTDENGNITTYEVDASGNNTKIIYADGSTKKFTYDQWNNCIIEENEIGVFTYHCYDKKGIYLLKSVQRVDGKAIDVTKDNIADILAPINYQDTSYIVEEYEYFSLEEAKSKFDSNLNGLLKTVRNAEGEEVAYSYDQYGNTVSETDAAGNTVKSTYDIMGNRLSKTTANGNLFTWKYDANGYATREEYPDGGIVISVYDKAGLLRQNVSQEVYVTEHDTAEGYQGEEGTLYHYDASGKTTSVKDALGNTVAYTYDSYGNIITKTMENGSSYRFEYDLRDRLSKEWYKENAESKEVLLKEITYIAMPEGGLKAVTNQYMDAENKVSNVVIYDKRGREIENFIQEGEKKTSYKQTSYHKDGTVKSITAPDSSITYYTYDAQGNLIESLTPSQIIDGKLYYVRQSNRYDRVGRLIKESLDSKLVLREENETVRNLAVNKTYDTNYTYSKGKLVEKQDANGTKTLYSYDGEGNITRIQVGEGNVAENTATIIEKTYDFRQNPLTEIVSIRSGDLGGYDFDNNEISKLITTYVYDKEGRVLNKTSPDGTETNYSYDALGNQIMLTVPFKDATGVLLGKKTLEATYDKDGQVKTMTDALGAKTEFTYDNRGNLVKSVDALGGITWYQYDLLGNKTLEVTPQNYKVGKPVEQMSRTEYTYDLAGRVKSQVEYSNKEGILSSVVTKTYEYNDMGLVTKEADALGNGTVYTYHPNGAVATEISPLEQSKENGEITRYCYDVYGNVTKTKRGEYILNYTYDALGNITNVYDSLGKVTSYTYDSLGRQITKTDGNGNVTEVSYNGLGLINKMKTPGDSSVEELIAYTQYDQCGRKLVVFDTVGNRTEYQYDTFGNITEEKKLDTSSEEVLVTSYGYDLNSNLNQTVNPEGTLATIEYDLLGRKTKENIVTGNLSLNEEGIKSTSFTYDKNGNLLSETDYLGNMKRYVYDDKDRLLTEYDALGNVVGSYVYDDLDRQISTEDALGNKITFAYDADGNVAKQTDALGGITTNTYDARHNLIATTDALGNTITYFYDGRNRLTGVLDAMEGYTSYEYDASNNLLVQKDSGGNRIAYTYNSANLTASRQDIGTEVEPLLDAPKEMYCYLGDGKLSNKVDRNGTITRYDYDGFGRLLTEEVEGVDGSKESKTYTYDKLGNILTMSDGTNTTIRVYDVEGRVVTKSETKIGSVTFLYDVKGDAGEVLEVKTTPDGVITNTTFDAVGRIKKVSTEGAKVATGSAISINANIATGPAITVNADIEATHYYNANGSRQSTVYADGTKEEYIYNANGRVLSIVHTNRYGQVLDSYSYSYDAVGNLITEKSNRGITEYSYDANYRIISILEPDGRKVQYTYDKAGNREKKIEGYLEEVRITTEYRYDASNRLLEEQRSNGEVIVYTYDANGNQLTRFEDKSGNTAHVASGSAIIVATGSSIQATSGSAITTNTVRTASGSAIQTLSNYSYDLFNRLTSYESGETKANYSYNAEDFRVCKNIHNATGNQETNYFYEGDKVLLEVDANGNVTARNTYSTYLVGRNTAAEGYYYLYNAHGDVVMLLDARLGEIAATYVYDAFGTLLSKTGEADNSITYAGYQYDEESGLYYVNARYYDSSMARFLTEDTYRGSQTDPLSLNRYTYCHNNPIRYYDPSGHFILAALASAVVSSVISAVVDYVDQKYIQKKGEINWGSVAYEAAVGGVFGVVGGGVGARAAKKASQFAIKQTAKTVAKTAVKTGLVEAAGGFVTDVGKQMVVDGKNIDEVDYGKAVKTAAVSGTSGAIGSTIGSVAKVAKTKVKSKATKYADDVAEKVVTKGKKVATESIEKANKATTTSITPTTPRKTSVTTPTVNQGNRYVDAIQTSNQNITGKKASASTVKKQQITGKQAGNVASGDTGFRKIDLQFFAEKGSGNGVKGGSQADFYVKPNGDVIPSTGYRYMPREANYIDNLKNTMEIPANPNGTYVTFDKFDLPNPGKLQVPHDASIRGSFDTLQIIDDVRIPNGKWGEASWLEPITNDFPKYGPGGATQAITNNAIKLNDLQDIIK